MIIISQNCLAANLYRHHIKEAFPHPFVYCVIDYTSMSNLIRSWNDIDFHKYEWLLKEYPILLLEHDIKIQFVHYTSTHDADEKYNKRLSRMQLCNYSNPLFAICNHGTTFPDALYTNDELDMLAEYNNVVELRGMDNMHPMHAADVFYNNHKELLNG